MAHFSSGEFAEFNRLLAAAVEHGLGLENAVALLERQATRPGVRDSLKRLGRALRDGRPLPEALQGPPALGSPEYVASVRSGLEAGSLAAVFRSAETYHALKARVLRNFWKVVLYLSVSFAFCGVILGLIAWYYRSFGKLFPRLHSVRSPELTLPFRIFHWGLGHIGIVFGILIAALGMACLAVRLLGRTRLACRVAYLLPVLGPILKNRDLGTFCSVLGMGLRAQVSPPQVFDRAAESVGNLWARHAIGLAQKRVTEGETISSALYYGSYFPRSLAWGISLGEARGDLPETIEMFARVYEATLERSFEALFQILTPLGLLVTANLVYGSALGIMLPILFYGGGWTLLGNFPDLGSIIRPLLLMDGCFFVALSMTYLLVIRRRVKIFLLAEHLSGWASQDLPLPMGLRVLGRDVGGLFGLRMTRMARRLGEGATFSESLARAPGTFPPLLRRMVVLGEKSGNLRVFLQEAANSYRLIAEPPHGSLYFFLNPVAMTVMVNLCLSLVLPGISTWSIEVFRQMGVQNRIFWLGPWLILASRILLALALAGIAVIFMGGTSPQFGVSPFRFLKPLVDRLLLCIPIVRRAIQDASLHAFCLSTGQFLRAGATMVEAVRATAEAEPNAVYRQRYLRLARELEGGRALSKGAERVPHFEGDFLWLAKTGESAGNLPEQLLQGAMLYDSRSRYFGALAARAAIPAFVLANGALVLGVGFLVFVPLGDLLKGIGPW